MIAVMRIWKIPANALFNVLGHWYADNKILWLPKLK